MENATNHRIYKDMARRTDGDIYIGVVGPVRTGKSTLIKKFMEQMVLPNIEDSAWRDRATDEMPQSSAGRTIMTTEPKFIPEEAVRISVDNNAQCNVRLIDCVGYIVPSSLGYIEDDQPRMVMTPWFDREIPFNMAAEIGTDKVINEHSTIGLVVTTDGSISDIPRDEYEEAEQRVINALSEIGKPFAVVLNCVHPESEQSQELATRMEERYQVPVTPLNCLALDSQGIEKILQSVLYQFPLKQIAIEIPRWIVALEKDHWLKKALYDAVKQSTFNIKRIRELSEKLSDAKQCEYLNEFSLDFIDFGQGSARACATVDPKLFYRVIGESTGIDVKDDTDLMPMMIQLAAIKREHEKYRHALEEVAATGYGIVMPAMEELTLEEPEIIKQGGRYGVKLRASAPSIHLMRADISTEVSPIVGSEKQSQELVEYLLSEFESDPTKIWSSNIFGKSLHELVNEGLHNKLYRMPSDARGKLTETIERIINDGCSGLICIIL
ncbi:MAG: stage IV sporulation protein A [Candidatus Fimivivens sp.]